MSGFKTGKSGRVWLIVASIMYQFMQIHGAVFEKLVVAHPVKNFPPLGEIFITESK
jgi:hypothetical protein